MEFSHDMALALFESKDPFPVDFDNAWQWIGYSSKQKAKTKLFNNFEDGVDFLTKRVKTPEGGRPSELILLSNDCFKSLGMMAGTEKGKEIRRYFLDCERKAKEAAQIIPAQQEELEKLRLQLELARTQERLFSTSQAIATMHGTEMVALILGKPDAVVVQTEVVKQTVIVDQSGRSVQENDGVGIGYLTKALGFKTNSQTWAWLESIGYGKNSGKWVEELTAHTNLKLPRDVFRELKRAWSQRRGSRQRLIGES